MKKSFLALILSTCFGASQALVVNYQPTPYPLKMADGSAMPQDLDKVHIIDGWLTNSYSTSLVRDGQLKIGGWGDVYVFGLNFDLTGLPINPNRTTLWLNSFAIPSGSTQMQYQICIPSTSWDTKTTFATRSTLLGCTQPFSAPGYSWNGWNITPWYQNWKNKVWGSYGLIFSPMLANNNFIQFRSSRYADFAADPAADGKRPILQFDITPSIELKMPFPAGYSWLVTTEPSGYDCKGVSPWPDTAHQGTSTFPWTSPKGDQIGIMGTTGKMPDGSPTSTGVHVHFGLRYKNDGSPSVPELTRAVMEGMLWKSYQTECKTNSNGVPTDWGRYYNSTNVPTGK